MENLGFKGSLGVQLTCFSELVEKKIKIQQPWLYEQYFTFQEPYFLPKTKNEVVLTNLMKPKRPKLGDCLQLPITTELSNETLIILNQRIKEVSVSEKSCAVHIKVVQTRKSPSQYSEACLGLSATQKENMDYVVFGRDMDWCKKFLAQEEHVQYRFVEPHPNDLIDLCTINTFPYQVMDPDSAFGLWAAGMNSNNKKQIFLDQKTSVVYDGVTKGPALSFLC